MCSICLSKCFPLVLVVPSPRFFAHQRFWLWILAASHSRSARTVSRSLWPVMSLQRGIEGFESMNEKPAVRVSGSAGSSCDLSLGKLSDAPLTRKRDSRLFQNPRSCQVVGFLVLLLLGNSSCFPVQFHFITTPTPYPRIRVSPMRHAITIFRTQIARSAEGFVYCPTHRKREIANEERAKATKSFPESAGRLVAEKPKAGR